MADVLVVEPPVDFTRSKNRDHTGQDRPIDDTTRFSYGTAGFRTNAQKLPFIVFRMGYLAGLRARELNKCIGIMITASHNPAEDNGVKIVDPMGEMLAAHWEKIASDLVNCTDEQFPEAVRTLEAQTPTKHSLQSGRVVCAIDTRVSGPHLMEAARAGAALLNVKFESHGILTTPQLHFIVRCENDPEFGVATEKGYYESISTAFEKLIQLTPGKPSSIVLDCANGVGAPKMRQLMAHMPAGVLSVDYRNENGPLNSQCGADFVKIGQCMPSNFSDVTPSSKCASFDGDADRLVYFRRVGSGKSVTLLDGDRIAVLIAKYIKQQLDEAQLSDLSLGIIQTAYANGASTKYIAEKVGVKPVFVPTGVKHLHHEAIKYDIGIYFEANGHGTVVFSEKFDRLVRKSTDSNPAVKRLQLFSRVINEVVGDAMADLLAVEVILRHFDWSIEDWEKKMYTDVPSIQIKVPVVDRSKYKTTWEETTLLEPAGMQEKIDNLVKEFSDARAFVRPSGTENIVRVYAEATTPDAAKQLGEAIEKLVKI